MVRRRKMCWGMAVRIGGYQIVNAVESLAVHVPRGALELDSPPREMGTGSCAELSEAG